MDSKFSQLNYREEIIVEPYLYKNPAFLSSSRIPPNNWVPKELVDECSNFDFCLVVKALSGNDSNVVCQLVNLFERRFTTQMHHNSDCTELYILITASLIELRNFAQRIKFKMLCDPNNLFEIIKDNFKLPSLINEGTQYSPISPYECIYVPYTKEMEKKMLFWCPPGMSHPFRSSVRLKLLAMMIDNELAGAEESERVRKHITHGNVLAFFPLHSPHFQRHLTKDWLQLRWPWKAPLFQIKEYFGEKIALNVALMSHYTTWLLLPAVLSIPVTAIIFIDYMDYRSPFIPCFAFILGMSVC